MLQFIVQNLALGFEAYVGAPVYAVVSLVVLAGSLPTVGLLVGTWQSTFGRV